MKITEVSCSVRRLIALAKYENVTYEAHAKASVEEGDNASEVYDTLKSFCQAKIRAELDRLNQ